MPGNANQDKSAPLWYGKFPRADSGGKGGSSPAPGQDALPSPKVVPGPGAGADIAVEIRLFGILSSVTPERPVILHLPAGFTAGDVICEMGNRYGADFLEKITTSPGQTADCCQIFINGLPVDDLGAPLEAEGSSAEIEMILLSAYEGG